MKPSDRKGFTRAGESALVKRVAKDLVVTPSQQKLLDAAEAIRLNPEAVEKAYMARELVQCTLPHRDPGNVEQWARTNGNMTLGITPGRDIRKNRSLGYPYGSIPRLLLFWLTAEAVRTKSPHIELGNSLDEFMREVGLNPETGGGKRGDAKRLREQMLRLFRARISIEFDTQDRGESGLAWDDMQVAPDGMLWWDARRPEQSTLWGSWIELGAKFFAAITARPVPVDMRVLRALKRSPLALDLYAWATYKSFVLSLKPGIGKSTVVLSIAATGVVPWVALQQQFGTDLKTPKNFRQKARAALKKIQTVYPDLKLEFPAGGVRVLPSSKPSVPPLPRAR